MNAAALPEPVVEAPDASARAAGTDVTRALPNEAAAARSGMPACRRAVWRVAVWLGVAAGGLAAWCPGGLFILLAVGLTGILLWRSVGALDRRFIVWLFILGFAVRAALSLGLDTVASVAGPPAAAHYAAPHGWDLGVTDSTRQFMKVGDSDYLSLRAYAMTQYLKGVREPSIIFRVQEPYGWNGYTYVVGAFYYLFGFSPMSVKLVNCFLGALLGPAIFLLARAYFERRVARWAAAVVAWVPSLILWSASNLKEPSIILLTTLLFWIVLQIQGARSLWTRAGWLLAFLGATAIHATLRSPAYTDLLVASMVAATLLCRLRWRWGIAVIAGVLAAIGWWPSLQAPIRVVLAGMFHRHLGFVGTPGVSYRYLAAEFYDTDHLWAWASAGRIDGGILASIARALWHYLLEPFPWRCDNAFGVLVYPQVVIWYFVLPVALLGLWSAVHTRPRQTLGLALTLLGWALLGALTGGNPGTTLRMRDMVSPFLLMFACAQAWHWLARPQSAEPAGDART